MLIFLESATGYIIRGSALQIQTVDGSVVNYTSVPPAEPVAPTAIIGGPEQADSGETLTFDGSGSTAGSTAIARYDWDLGDGTALSGASVQYAYNEAGSYTIRLTVTDQAGLTGSATQPVQVRPVVDVQPPTAAIEGPEMAFVGEQVTFSAANSSQGTGAIASYQWQSGDGNNTGPQGEDSFTTIYVTPGTYYATVTVADANGLGDSATMAIQVNATPGGTEWILQNTIPGTTISLQFANGNITGFAGCNNYNATYTILVADPENSISVSDLTSTGSVCSQQIMNQEQGYFASLQSGSSYTIAGNTLTLTTGQGILVFRAAVP
jgi:heat shock protein HslJ